MKYNVVFWFFTHCIDFFITFIAVRLFKNISNKHLGLLFIFIISWFVELKFTIPRHKFLFVPRVIIIILLGVYYVTLVKKKKYNYFFLAFLFCDFLTAIFFSMSFKNINGMIFFNLSRVLLILLFLNFKDRLDKKHFLPIVSLFFISLSFILYIIYDNTLFFYLSVSATLLLAVILSLSFIALLSYNENKGNLYFFLASCVFLFTDTLFSSQRISSISNVNLFVTSTLYYLAYFLILLSVLKKVKS